MCLSVPTKPALRRAGALLVFYWEHTLLAEKNQKSAGPVALRLLWLRSGDDQCQHYLLQCFKRMKLVFLSLLVVLLSININTLSSLPIHDCHEERAGDIIEDFDGADLSSAHTLIVDGMYYVNPQFQGLETPCLRAFHRSLERRDAPVRRERRLASATHVVYSNYSKIDADKSDTCNCDCASSIIQCTGDPCNCYKCGNYIESTMLFYDVCAPPSDKCNVTKGDSKGDSKGGCFYVTQKYFLEHRPSVQTLSPSAVVHAGA